MNNDVLIHIISVVYGIDDAKIENDYLIIKNEKVKLSASFNNETEARKEYKQLSSLLLKHATKNQHILKNSSFEKTIEALEELKKLQNKNNLK